MTSSKRKSPLPETFAPELLELLIAGSRSEVSILCGLGAEAEKKATRLCFRLNSLRKSLTEHGHEMAKVCAATHVSKKENSVIVKPSDADVAELIKEQLGALSTQPSEIAQELSDAEDSEPQADGDGSYLGDFKL